MIAALRKKTNPYDDPTEEWPIADLKLKMVDAAGFEPATPTV